MVTKEELKNAVSKGAIEGKLPCAIAWRIADDLGVSRKEIGDMANELKIKISSCQLGCFK